MHVQLCLILNLAFIILSLQTSVPVSNMRCVVNSANSISVETCGQLDSDPQPINLVECASNGLIGAYDWEMQAHCQ